MICQNLSAMCQNYGCLPHQLLELDPAEMSLAYRVGVKAQAK